MPELVSVGKCLYCNQEFTKANISRHLAKHLAEKNSTGKQGKSFHLKIETNPKMGRISLFFAPLGRWE